MSSHHHNHKPVTSRVVLFDGDKTTVLLKRCRCGSVDYERIPGVWAWEELVPPKAPAKPVSDRQFLRAMGIKA